MDNELEFKKDYEQFKQDYRDNFDEISNSGCTWMIMVKSKGDAPLAWLTVPNAPLVDCHIFEALDAIKAEESFNG